jgi:hypothetical protein
MLGSLQTTGWSFARRFGLMAIIVTSAGAILVGYFVNGERTTSVDQAADARPAGLGPCFADAQSVAPGDGAPSWRFSPCAPPEAAGVCDACANCPPGAWCAPIKTRGTGPRSPGGGPDD